MYTIKRIFNPEIFQGKYKRSNYFEGWYYKIIDKPSNNIFAIIPGVAVSKQKSHSFIQFVDAKRGFSEYISYPKDAFKYSENELDISLLDNHFDRSGVRLNLTSSKLTLIGDLEFTDVIPFPKRLFSPGIMGPFSFVPFMECHHGIVNIHNRLKGYLCYNGTHVDFTDGYGYIEKDWGKSFPHSWIWLQTNNFSRRDTSLMFSIASIPWFHREFDGFISFLRFNNSFLRFATYTGAKVKKLTLVDKILEINIEDSKYLLGLKVKYNEGVLLKAPKKGVMEVDLTESITSTVEAELIEKPDRIVFTDTGENTGLELAGNYKKFLT